MNKLYTTIVTHLKKVFLISILTLTSCGVSKQLNTINRIDKIVMKIDNQTELKTNTFDLREYLKNEDGYFNVSKLNGKLKRIFLNPEKYNNKIVTTIYLENNLPILIRQNQTLTTKAELTNGTIETFDNEYKTDFYILNWKEKIYQKKVIDGFYEIQNEYKFKKEQVDNIISIANKLIIQ